VAQQRDIAISGLLISQSQRLGDANPALSRLLSVAAWRIHPSSAARYAMLAAAGRPGNAVLTSPGGAVTSVAFSPRGQILATGNADGTVRLWDVAAHRQITALTRPAGPVTSVAFSPRGQTLATGNADGTVRLWDVAAHRQITALTGPAGTVNSVAFSPDDATLASGSADGIWLWAPATNPCVCGPPAASHLVLTGPTGTVNSVAFSPDGTTLAAGSTDGTARLWDVATHRLITTLTRPVGAVNSVAFSPDGTTLATGNADHTVRLWHVAYLMNVIPHLCASAGRSLTRAEWARYVPGLAYQRICP
jgi:WD40 repeat protein